MVLVVACSCVADIWHLAAKPFWQTNGMLCLSRRMQHEMLAAAH